MLKRMAAGVMMAAGTVGLMASTGMADAVPDPETRPELKEDDGESWFGRGPLAPVGDAMADLNKELEPASLTLELGITGVGQVATDVQSGPNDLWSASYDFVGLWEPADAISVGWLVEGGEIIGADDRHDLSSGIGTVFGVNDDLDGQEVAVSELWVALTNEDETMLLTIGKIDQTVFLDANAVANDETTQFLNGALVNSAAIAFPDNGLGINFTVDLSPNVYLSLGAGDGRADARETGFSTVQDERFFGAAEVGITHTIDGLGEGNWRLIGWGVDQAGADSDQGVALSGDQALGDNGLTAMLRAGWSDGAATGVETMVSAGLGWDRPLNRPADMIGVAWVWADPTGGQDEHVVEAFYRLQLTDHLAVTPDVQLLIDPAGSDESVVGVFGTRVQLSF